MYNFDWSVVWDLSLWMNALGVTLSYAVVTSVAGLLIGVIFGLILVARVPVLWWIGSGYVLLFRSTPLLVQIVWFFYALPMVTGYALPDWFAAGLGLTLYMGAFSAEIFRAGVISIEKGQWEASTVLGFSYWTKMRHIILPQATRRMVPPIVSQSILQLKNTSLLSVVAVPDLMYAASTLTMSTYRPLEVYTFAALMYLAVLTPVTLIASRFEIKH
ncbi:putative glutamine ABC transporter permease protein GlnM [Roseovarius sp. THAF27]|uniref:amino acid ABC transporter permease n=1 Tax=Roseovarius TaxID=74030 RepID=UPI001267F0AD|nr:MULTISPECIES: amino acid ABC transporter permease [Roseovarius]MBY5989598.1 amino acid ABC transporter permease [Roseovarius atlanticus]MBY6126143.1 amino acid ABC transporter permease [Roseovarius atlanticus]MBY6150637.1 amino acid ABC transporter permease [Roseovarius atlanticus]QFT82712.1 putative glutamine ABC transporter permease protein GlnM [Roseovarius sp. THAF27]QFT98258.1 putative glutamine ABC transporter permease protein GlnM [Roseovarius sp. THAF8]